VKGSQSNRSSKSLASQRDGEEKAQNDMEGIELETF
jgi:hypothetical protein